LTCQCVWLWVCGCVWACDMFMSAWLYVFVSCGCVSVNIWLCVYVWLCVCAWVYGCLWVWCVWLCVCVGVCGCPWVWYVCGCVCVRLCTSLSRTEQLWTRTFGSKSSPTLHGLSGLWHSHSSTSMAELFCYTHCWSPSISTSPCLSGQRTLIFENLPVLLVQDSPLTPVSDSVMHSSPVHLCLHFPWGRGSKDLSIAFAKAWLLKGHTHRCWVVGSKADFFRNRIPPVTVHCSGNQEHKISVKYLHLLFRVSWLWPQKGHQPAVLCWAAAFLPMVTGSPVSQGEKLSLCGVSARPGYSSTEKVMLC
jgi:hypothetical protein